MLFSYFILLPMEPLKRALRKDNQSRPIDAEEDADNPYQSEFPETAGLLAQPEGRSISPAHKSKQSWARNAWIDLRTKLVRAKALVVPYVLNHSSSRLALLSLDSLLTLAPSRYMIPLFLVYLAEYTINQGVAPTLLFPLAESPFKHFVSLHKMLNIQNR